MPEGLEAELYRRAAQRCVGRTIRSVDVDDRQPTALELRTTLPGLTFARARRIGKLVLLDTVDGPTLGLHFGMTGRLVVDGDAPIEQLEYSSGRDEAAWDRFRVGFDDGGSLRVNDPRRWAWFDLDPDESRLGPDLFEVDADDLVPVLGRRRSPLKSTLLDQSVIAGLGNLCVDEVLWQAGLSPLAPSDTIDRGHVERLIDTMGEHLPLMLERGGSHRGTIDPEVRAALPPCPRDGATLRRDRVGGRTTVWCPVHQLGSGSA